MKLTIQDATQFFNLMWSLQVYVNRKLAILPEVVTIEEYGGIPFPDKFPVREALYDNIELIDSFLEEFRGKLSKEESEIIKSWKQFQRGNFFIERLLKKHAIFIGGDKVYAVLALYETFEEVLGHDEYFLPYYTKTVLLPFKGKIIYDGLLQGYSVLFGSGIKADLKETYMAAKQNGRIIDTLDPQKQATKITKKKTPSQDWGPILDEISNQAKKLRSSSGAPAIQSPAFSLAKASIELAKIAVETPDDLDKLWRALKKVERASNKTATILHRAEY